MKTAGEETQVTTIALILNLSPLPPSPSFDKEALSSQKIRVRFCQKIERYI